MKELTQQEILFMKETRFTPTVLQCNEWNRTSLENMEDADFVARTNYNFDIEDLMNKLFDGNDDSISLEYTATYLLYTFFTLDQLETLPLELLTEWLKDFKYFGGFRKWTAEDIRPIQEEAVEIYQGNREFFQQDGHMWNRIKEN